jgi:non-specific serine/threonine protein kinase
MDSLVDFLSERHSLLVIDNCEHLISACAQFIGAILQRCPNLRIMATSREALGITGEMIWVVPPLSLPDQQPWTNPSSPKNAVTRYGESESVQLFVVRAAAISADFKLTIENGPWVAEICRRLDGMPLAIELAAARVRSLSAQQIAQRLDDRFHLLNEGSRIAEPRHQTLAATIDWSYALLSEVERKTLQGLSVFAGGATLEAAQAVCADGRISSAEVLDALSHLVEKSLVVVSRLEGSEVRYRLLETIRQYAREKLAESGDEAEAKNRHLNYFLYWVEQVEPHTLGPDRNIWLDRLDADHDNIRAALDWSLLISDGANRGLRLVAGMGRFWKVRSYFNEGRGRISAALLHPGSQLRTIERARALCQAGNLAMFQSDYSAVRTFAEETLAISRELGATARLEVATALELLGEASTETGDYAAARILYKQALELDREIGNLEGIATTLNMLGWVSVRTGDYARAESGLKEGLAASRQFGDQRQIAEALAGLGELALRRGQYQPGIELLRESLEISRASGEKWRIAIVLGSLGWVALRQHDFREMRKLLGESLAVRMETGDRGGVAWCLEKLAEADHVQSHFEKAVSIFGAAAAVRAPMGSMMDAVDRPDYERMISKLQSELGKEAFETVWREGQTMRLQQAVEYALAEPAGNEVSLKEKYGGLTGREREVAALIAQGKSNHEIARVMTVGTKTVETYVTRILNKLGFDSRVQIATWVIQKSVEEKEAK